MDGISNGMRAVEIMLRSGFFMVLAVTAFQDCRERRIRVSVFVIFGTAGIVLRGVELFLEINALFSQHRASYTRILLLFRTWRGANSVCFLKELCAE